VLEHGDLRRSDDTFLGWALSPSGTVVYLPGATFTITSDIDLFAVWKEEVVAEKYTVIYSPGSRGTFAAVTHTGLSYGDPTPAEPTVTGQTGWRFTGWAPARTTTVTGNVEYVAQWEQIQSSNGGSGPSPSVWYTVRFVDWDGTLLKSERVRSGGSATAPANPSREGHTFAGWDRGFTNVKSDITVTAQYEQKRVIPGPEPKQDPVPVWALLNLVLSVAGLILAILVLVCVLLQHRQKKKKGDSQQKNAKGQQNMINQNNRYGADNGQQKQRRKMWLFVTFALAIAGIVVFLLTENMRYKMALVDKWTIVNLIIFVVELIAIVLIFKRNKNHDDKATNEQRSTTPLTQTPSS